MRIKQLPPLIANQIAAGEVVERPASVVKELMENSLDAQADTIAIEISYGGLNQIKITDNGVGIVAEDLPLALAAHATSKIKTLDDLYAIGSMGFRGEALASIAAVAKVTVSSKPAQQEMAMMLRAHGTEMTLSPCARAVGTTVDVVDLFFNAPVRKRFLKSEKLEFQAIETVVKRFALSAPAITLTLKHNGKLVLSLPGASSEQTHLRRMTKILGSAFIKEAIYLDIEHSAMRLCGWISGVNFQRSQNDRLWVYINQRMVKDKLIQSAVKRVYEGLLHPGRFPSCVLYFTMHPTEIDVNVHPTKHEVRFQQPRLVFDFFTSQLTAALQSTPSFEYILAKETPSSATAQTIDEPYPKLSVSDGWSHTSDAQLPWVILNPRYILIFIRQHPYCVDILALHQYSLQMQLPQMVLPLTSRPLLVPARYPFSHVFNCTQLEISQYFSRLGLNIEWCAEHEVLIRSIPLCMPYLDMGLFLEGVPRLEQLDERKLIDLMNQSQVFDPRLLSLEEKKQLNELVLRAVGDEKDLPGVFKKLTSDDCRNIVHV